MESELIERTHDREVARGGGRTYVVGYDGSQDAAAAIRHAARAAGGRGHVIVLYALPSTASPADVRTAAECASTAASLLEQTGLDGSDVPLFETRIVTGPAWQALLAAAQRNDAAAIVIGAASQCPARGRNGRVQEAVLQHAERPVTIVRRS